MFDISMPEWIEDRNAYILMKFWEEEKYRDDFLAGKIFFNTSDFFSQCDDAGRGDQDEGNNFIVSPEHHNNIAVNLEVIDGKTMLVSRDYSQYPEKFVPGTVFSYSNAINRNRKNTCFYTSYMNLEKKIIDIPNEDHMKNFGSFGIIIIDRQKLYKKISEKIFENRNIVEAQLGFVEYINQEDLIGQIEWNPFKKRADFKDQNEFRITFVDNSKEAVILELGDLSEFIKPLNKEDMNRIYINGKGALCYPTYEKKETFDLSEDGGICDE